VRIVDVSSFVAADMRSAEGQQLVQRLIADSGALITNVAGRQWHSYATLVQLAPDLIHVEVFGRADGGTGVDYTVTAALRHRDASGAGAGCPRKNLMTPGSVISTCCSTTVGSAARSSTESSWMTRTSGD
jgi:2-methylfumaryl-CoA isomerase